MHSDNREGDGKFWDDTFERADSALLARNVSGWNEVHWATSDEDSTEYRHIATLPFKGVTFEFSAEHLELLIAANSFEPIRDRGKIIFALRGAKLHVSGGASADDKYHQVDRTALHLVETRPDHQHFRCVIGVYNTERRQLSGFIANTVPCRQAIYGYANGGDLSNMLPSGSYRMVVGTHKGRIGCLVEDEDFTVLRTRANYVYDTKDIWDETFPADNLHPAFANSSAEFSSWGCLTIRGGCPQGTDQFTGEYKEFRRALGLVRPLQGDYGLKFSCVMLTGLEAAFASKKPELAAVELARLRHGSRGERVRALQQKLALTADGVFGARTKKALADHQKREFGWADGIFGPEMDAKLRFHVLLPTLPMDRVGSLPVSQDGNKSYVSSQRQASTLSWCIMLGIVLALIALMVLAINASSIRDGLTDLLDF